MAEACKFIKIEILTQSDMSFLLKVAPFSFEIFSHQFF